MICSIRGSELLNSHIKPQSEPYVVGDGMKNMMSGAKEISRMASDSTLTNLYSIPILAFFSPYQLLKAFIILHLLQFLAT